MTDESKTEEQEIRCVRCDVDLTQAPFYHMCDNAGGFCNTCWEANDSRLADICVMVHGEGCHTAIIFRLVENQNEPRTS